jgi:hypothetical protein
MEDFVKVVRCRDCMHWLDKPDVSLNPMHSPDRRYCPVIEEYTKPAFFCAVGRGSDGRRVMPFKPQSVEEELQACSEYFKRTNGVLTNEEE